MQFFDRVRVLENNCWKARNLAKREGRRLRTQVRIGYKDMELLIKEGEETRWRQVDLDHFGSLPAANLQASDTLLSAMSDSPPRGRRKRSRGSPQSSPEATRRLEN